MPAIARWRYVRLGTLFQFEDRAAAGDLFDAAWMPWDLPQPSDPPLPVAESTLDALPSPSLPLPLTTLPETRDEPATRSITNSPVELNANDWLDTISIESSRYISFSSSESPKMAAASSETTAAPAVRITPTSATRLASTPAALAIAPAATSPTTATQSSTNASITPVAANNSPDYYIANGEPIGLTIRTDEIAIGMTNATDAEIARLTAPGAPLAGLTFVRFLDSRGAVLQGPNASSLLNTPPRDGISFVVPVFTNSSGGRDAVELNDVIVALNAGVSAESFFSDSRFAGYEHLSGSTDQFIATLATGSGLAAVNLADQLNADPRVRWSEPNFYEDFQELYAPNDPDYAAGYLWNMNNTGQFGGVAGADGELSQAWDINPGGSPNGIISVVDDGVQTTQPDLKPWVNPGDSTVDGTDNDGNGYVDDVNGWDFVNNDNQSGNATIDDAHGTAVAGIAAAIGNNGIGVVGAAFNAQVLSSRIFQGNEATSDANIASAVYYAAGRDANGLGSFASIDVMNCSWGGGGYSNAITEAFTYATTEGRGGLGTVVTAASGNSEDATLLYPADLSLTNPGVIAVGASNSKNALASYSEYGPGLDLVAPSGDYGDLWVDTTDLTGDEGYTVNDYTGIGSNGGFGGTSAAAPLAAGVAELVISQAAVKGVTLTAAQVRSLLMNGTNLIGGSTYGVTDGNSVQFGQGLIDAYTSVAGVGKAGLSVLSSTAQIASGSTMPLGSAFVGGSSTLTYRIRNTGTSTLALSNLAVTGSGFSIDSIGSTSLALGQSTTITVRFAPTATGAATGTLSFTSNDPSNSSFTLNLSGTGVAANISGEVFQDWNGNGTLDSNDPAISGRTVYLDTNNNGILDRATYTASPNVAIPDANTNGVASTISVSGATVPVKDLTVTVNITHPNDGDIVLALVSPSGTYTLLTSESGIGGANFTNTIFDDAATVPIQNGVAPFSGSFKPEGYTLVRMDGETANGNWTLTAYDLNLGNTGTLLNWSIAFDAEPTAVSDSQGLYAFGGLANGNYTVRVATPSGWTATSGSGGDPVTISGANSDFSNINFGSAKDNRAYFTVFNDENGDGIQDGAEPAVGGRTVYLDSNNNGALDVAPPPTVVMQSTPLAIPDDNAAGVASTLNVSGLTGTILDLSVTINVTHTAVGDLRLNLVSPSGTVITLVNQRGEDGVNFTGTTFDDSAIASIAGISDLQSPYTGSYVPETPLAAVDGQSPIGTWTMQAFDLGPNDVGTLDNWSLSFTTAASEPTGITAANGNAYIDLPAGTNTVRLEPLTGWRFTNPASGAFSLTAAGAPLFASSFGVQQVPVVLPLIVNGGAAQRSMVTNVTVPFSEHVLFSGPAASAFTVTGPNGAVPFTASVDDSGSGTKVTLTFTGNFTGYSVPDGIYSVAVNSSLVTDAALNALVPSAPQTFFRLFGDINGDGSVDAGVDQQAFVTAFGLTYPNPGYNAAFDYNGDGTISAGIDQQAFVNRFGTTI